MTAQGGLKRSLGLWAIVGLGLGYMTPTVLFDTFGIVTKETNGVVPLAYLVALVVMLFTAVSYGRMAKVSRPLGRNGAAEAAWLCAPAAAHSGVRHHRRGRRLAAGDHA
jgi:amino acid transporter